MSTRVILEFESEADAAEFRQMVTEYDEVIIEFDQFMDPMVRRGNAKVVDDEN